VRLQKNLGKKAGYVVLGAIALTATILTGGAIEIILIPVGAVIGAVAVGGVIGAGIGKAEDMAGNRKRRRRERLASSTTSRVDTRLYQQVRIKNNVVITERTPLLSVVTEETKRVPVKPRLSSLPASVFSHRNSPCGVQECARRDQFPRPNIGRKPGFIRA
jgi:hypothetical protein